MAKKLSNNCKLFVSIYDLSLGGQEINFSGLFETLESTDLSESAPTHIMGVGESGLTYSGLFDDIAAGNEKGLSTLVDTSAINEVSLFLGNAVGNRVATSQMRVSGYDSAPRLRQLVPIVGEFRSEAVATYGISLQPKITKTANFNGASQDNLASSASGGIWVYHVVALTATGGNAQWIIHLEESSTNDGGDPFSDKDSVTLTHAGGAVSARRSISGTIKQYTRIRLEADFSSSGSITIAVMLSRS